MSDMFAMFGQADDIVPAAAPTDAPTDYKIGDKTLGGGEFGSKRFRPGVKSLAGTKGLGTQNIIVLPSVAPYTDAAAAAMRAKGIDVFDLTPNVRKEALLPGNSHQCNSGFNGLSHILSPIHVGVHYGDDRDENSSMQEIWDTQSLRTLYPNMFNHLPLDCYTRTASSKWVEYFRNKGEKWKDNPKITHFLPKTTLNFWGVQLDSPDKMEDTPTLFSFTVPSGDKQAGLGAKLREAMVRIATPLIHNGKRMEGTVVNSLVDPKNPINLYSYSFDKKRKVGSTNPARDTSYDNPALVPLDSDVFLQTLRGLGWGPDKFELLLHKYFLHIAANPLFAQFNFASTELQQEEANRYVSAHGYTITPTDRGCVVAVASTGGYRPQARPAPTEAPKKFSLTEIKRNFMAGGEEELRGRKDLPTLLDSPFVLGFFANGEVTDYATAIFLQLAGNEVPEDQQGEYVTSIVSIIRELGNRPTLASRNGFMDMIKDILPTQGDMLMSITIEGTVLFWNNLP